MSNLPFLSLSVEILAFPVTGKNGLNISKISFDSPIAILEIPDIVVVVFDIEEVEIVCSISLERDSLFFWKSLTDSSNHLGSILSNIAFTSSLLTLKAAFNISLKPLETFSINSVLSPSLISSELNLEPNELSNSISSFSKTLITMFIISSFPRSIGSSTLNS